MELEAILPALMFALVLVGVLSGYPIGFVLGGLALTFGLVCWGPQVIPALFFRCFMVLKTYVFAAIPLFVFMGIMLERPGSSERLFHAAHLLMGGLRGGLGMATIFVCTIFAAATGIVGASVVTMGLLALPPMLKRGYNKELASGCILAGGTLGILIPPTIMIVVYGSMANISVARLFFGAFAILLEAVPPELSKIITERCRIPTLGIGAGIHVDGQILIVSDMLGMFEAFTPRFVKKYAALGEIIEKAFGDYIEEIRTGSFPKKNTATECLRENQKS